MSSTRINAWLALNGIEVRVRFDTQEQYMAFKDEVSVGVPRLRLMFLKNGQRIYIRPSSVDAISRDGERG